MRARVWTAVCVVAATSLVGIAYAQAVMPIRPGMWEITVRMTSMTGMPPQMQGIMGRPQTIRNCVTPEQARQGVRSVLQRESKGKCSFAKFRASGGTYSHEMVCTGQGRMVMTASGTYSPTSYTGSSRMVMNGGQMVITGNAAGRLVGPCRK
jgi:hypothetical protein